MSNISMVEASLPPGFRFHPKDEELIFDYLMKKVDHCDSLLMVEVDLNQCEPWDLPEAARVGSREWYFYSQRDRKYATGLRTNRATAYGYWKATGKDKPVLRKGTLVGMRKTLVFYVGRAPKGRKTDWVMHEFRLEGPLAHVNQISSLKEDWVLCRVLYKSRESPAKPSMGSCYGNTNSSSSSLPPLMDSYISFDQTQANLLDDDQYEQVPCFSLVSECQPNSIISHNISIGPNIPTKNFIRTSYGNLPLSMGSNIPYSENKAMRGLSDYLIRQENNINVKGSRSFGEGNSENYLSELGNISSLWS